MRLGTPHLNNNSLNLSVSVILKLLQEMCDFRYFANYTILMSHLTYIASHLFTIVFQALIEKNDLTLIARLKKGKSWTFSNQKNETNSWNLRLPIVGFSCAQARLRCKGSYTVRELRLDHTLAAAISGMWMHVLFGVPDWLLQLQSFGTPNTTCIHIPVSTAASVWTRPYYAHYC